MMILILPLYDIFSIRRQYQACIRSRSRIVIRRSMKDDNPVNWRQYQKYTV